MCPSCKNELVLDLLNLSIEYSDLKNLSLEDASESVAYAYDILCEAVEINDINLDEDAIYDEEVYEEDEDF